MISARTTTPRQKQNIKKQMKIAFSITWTLKLNVAFLYLSNGLVIYTSGRFLTRHFEFLIGIYHLHQANGESFALTKASMCNLYPQCRRWPNVYPAAYRQSGHFYRLKKVVIKKCRDITAYRLRLETTCRH